MDHDLTTILASWFFSCSIIITSLPTIRSYHKSSRTTEKILNKPLRPDKIDALGMALSDNLFFKLVVGFWGVLVVCFLVCNDVGVGVPLSLAMLFLFWAARCRFLLEKESSTESSKPDRS